MSKYIRLASDLHLEAWKGRGEEFLFSSFIPAHELDKHSILVLAGDISSDPDQLVAFLKVAKREFWSVIYVPGNHELYRKNFDSWNSEMRARFDAVIPEVSTVVSDETRAVVVDGVRFILSTMWADGGKTPLDNIAVKHGLNDFRLIAKKQDWTLSFTVQDMIHLYKTAKSEINRLLQVSFDGKTVVVTHHLPSRELVSKRFIPRDGSDGINGGFVGACDEIFNSPHAPDLWLHGHTHDRISKKIGNTRIECNPTGYQGEWRNGFCGGKPVYIDLDTMEAVEVE